MADSQAQSAQSAENSSDAFFDKHCGICSKSGKHVEATDTCLDCRQTLCSGCLKDHNKFDAMKGHHIVKKAMTIKGRPALPSQTCDQHVAKLVDMYCLQHDQVCCSACIAIRHKRCEDIAYVPTISAGTKTSPELRTVLRDVNDILVELQQRKKARENDKKRTADERCRADRDIHESANRVIKAVTDLKEKSLQKVQQKFKEFQQRIDGDIKKISDTIALLEHDNKGLLLPTCDNESLLFVTMKQSKVHGELGTDLNTEMGTKLRREALHFNIDHEIEEYVKKLDSLGELETPFTSYSVLGQYNTKLKDDKLPCCIADICPMPDGQILLTDRDNDKLKRLDALFNLVDNCQLPGYPFSICNTGPLEVAVALGKKNSVQFVSVTGTLTPTRSFHVGKACRGIAYNNGQIFITCGGYSNSMEGPGEVRVYNKVGDLLRTLPKQTTSSGFWTCPYGISLTHCSKLLVADEKHGIVSMDMDGTNVTKTPLNACNLCVQHRCLWFFSGATTNVVYQVNSNGSSLGPLLTMYDGIDTTPTSVCYQRNGNKLIVGLHGRDYIKVFNLFRR